MRPCHWVLRFKPYDTYRDSRSHPHGLMRKQTSQKHVRVKTSPNGLPIGKGLFCHVVRIECFHPCELLGTVVICFVTCLLKINNASATLIKC